MDIIVILFLALGFGGIAYGMQKLKASFQTFLQLKRFPTRLRKHSQTHALYLTLSSIGLGLLGLALVWETGTNLFLAFLAPFAFALAALATWTVVFFRQNQILRVEYRQVLLANFYGLLLISIVMFFVSLEIVEVGLTYPLPKGIPFGSPLITFYAVFILSGALLAYSLSEREFIKLGKKKGYVEDIFLVAFPAGILGARLWYVWGQWSVEFANQPFWKIFAIWEGGLAIMGGALGGALAGIAYVLIKRKDIHLLQAIDIGVPTILVAQAIGRWGNFFNQEVYGVVTNIDAWQWLPTFIQKQMTIDGQFRVPLFLIESLINLSGYFVIRFGLGHYLKSYLKKGDQALMYLVWYGLTRGVMEPLRNPSFNMGAQGDWSLIWGWVFFAVGILAIAVNHWVVPRLQKVQ